MNVTALDLRSKRRWLRRTFRASRTFRIYIYESRPRKKPSEAHAKLFFCLVCPSALKMEAIYPSVTSSCLRSMRRYSLQDHTLRRCTCSSSIKHSSGDRDLYFGNMIPRIIQRWWGKPSGDYGPRTSRLLSHTLRTPRQCLPFCCCVPHETFGSLWCS
jgi:hypothetical protein